VEELGKCLHSFSEHGLRHRDLRPGAILVRQKDPLDLVVTGFGSARLSDFDLDIVSPLETTRYSAPEAIAGGVAAASDWWSLGMILLE
ncbi:protein kinase domain-containing protein, partial [Escherichia coli]